MQGIQWIVHYLDDYLILGAPDSEQCQQALETLQRVCQDMGVPLAPDKTHGPSTQLEFLGIGFNTQKLQLQLPERKRVALFGLVKELASRKSATKLELQSLAGKLIHAAKVVRPGWCLPGQHMSWHQLESALATRSVLLGISGWTFRGGPCYSSSGMAHPSCGITSLAFQT